MGAREDRVKKIHKMVMAFGSVTIQQLAEDLNVSKMTVRRDLDHILTDPDIQLVRGMLIYNAAPDTEESKYSVLSAATRNRSLKERIALKAVSMLEPDDTIIIDAGSTTEMLARIIPDSLPLDIICFSLNILNEVLKNKHCRITLPGGEYHASSMVFQSREGIGLLGKNRVKKAFISAYGVNFRLGVTCAADFERELKLTAINSAEQRILLADSSKFGKVNHFYFADLEDFDTIVTDNQLPEETGRQIRNKGIDLILV